MTLATHSITPRLRRALAVAALTLAPTLAAVAQEKVDVATIEKIKSGELQPFKGPITKQDGSVGVEAGKVIDDGTLLGLNWYVKGVDDKIPQ